MGLGQNRVRLLCMLTLTLVFFVVEVVVSRITASLAMLSDSFHMLSDVIALIVALIAVSFAETTRATSKNTYGWIRAEVMGALVNAVFLTALCFTIFLEAVERYTQPHEIENPRVVIWVGVAGLLVNVLGLFLFHGHAGFGGHGHAHGGHSHAGHSHAQQTNHREKPKAHEEACNLMINSSQGDHTCEQKSDSLNIMITAKASLEDLDQSPESASQLNMRGVFLHVLGDALGSIVVVVNALIFTFVWTPCHSDQICYNPCRNTHLTDHHHVNSTVLSISKSPDRIPRTISVAGPCWVLYLDPTLCLIMVCILLYTTFPLLKESALILLQTVPEQIDMPKLKGKLRSLDGVLAVHDLHIWQLAGARIIATAHIKCTDPALYMDIAKRIKGVFHDEGIHATTVQPEFSAFSEGFGDPQCELSCRSQCKPKLCCNPTKRAKPEEELDKCRHDKPHCHAVEWGDGKKVDDAVHTEMESSV
ncbi:proton-coupled zinc antiporter SLC30A1 [Danio aesculapii]|uniref:proton-coupled zinc antiporter SLC30A1 n=1 Tax=Danio aesculapii TaxID=1142201 RepID=UPI0024C0D0FA|nr:proton-coupled zinc antiporter SLC30A1 [Danio aesculapii]